ncbi:hypothetical protein E6H21_06135 [Candidatus Bathyarchaeota archaeon]|nr:MAG: hypothetical protein E6H21_06135 [Candidatus Bathyarchaeota archaeon]
MQRWVRLGMFALPCSGLLGTISILLPGVFIDPSVDPRGFAEASGSIGLGNMLGIVALVLWLVGIQALYSFLAGMSVGRWALVALIFSFAGIGFFLPLAGILAFAAPVAGRAYLNGDKNAVSVITDSIALSNPAALLFGGLSVLLFIVGSIIFGLVIWRCQVLPRWAGIIYAVAGTLSFLSAPLYNFSVALFGGLLLLIGGGWISASVARRKRT